MGAKAVKAQSIHASPTSMAPRRELSPRVACRDKWRRIELLAEIGRFVEQHREKRRLFLAGATNILFPAGTYRFVREFGMCCAEV